MLSLLQYFWNKASNQKFNNAYYNYYFKSLEVFSIAKEKYRGYYTVARRYEYYFRVVKTIFFILYGQKSGQANRKSRGKTRAFFTRYIFFHIFTSENMENMSVLVYGKTPIFSNVFYWFTYKS